MSEKFKRISDIDLAFVVDEMKRLGYPEDSEFMRELEQEARDRVEAADEKEE